MKEFFPLYVFNSYLACLARLSLRSFWSRTPVVPSHDPHVVPDFHDSAPYLNQWFTVPKKNGTLCFIQDPQPVNKVTIRNAGIGPTIDEFAEAFAPKVDLLGW